MSSTYRLISNLCSETILLWVGREQKRTIWIGRVLHKESRVLRLEAGDEDKVLGLSKVHTSICMRMKSLRN